jgi:hypothetical protein
MWFFKRKSNSSMVLITIGSSAVSGAYVHYKAGQTPTIFYTTRQVIEQRTGEDLQAAMLRSLDQIGTDLIEKGAPVLRRETGSGHVDGVLVSVAGPWQETHVRTETIQPGKPFVFTRAILSEAVAAGSKIPEDRVGFGEQVIATILNGYDIPNAIGKKANRAEVVILTSVLVCESSITRMTSPSLHSHR